MNPADLTDLLARTRRNVISADEKRRLDAELDATPELRLLLRAGLGFDAEAPALPGDERLIARIASSLERSRPDTAPSELRASKPSAFARPKGRRFAPLLAAALYLVIGAVVGVAAAATYWALPPLSPRAVRVDSSPAKIVSLAAPSGAKPALASRQTSAPALPLGDPPRTNERGEGEPQGEPAGAAPARSRRADRAQRAVSSAVAAPRSASAAELYALANQARVQGTLPAAISAYLDLQTRFAGSNEASASLLTLGNLYLVSGQPLLALEQFRAHQRVGGAGFGVESLWGMSVAFGRLERHAEEQQSLLLLLSRYPDSAYEAAARRKLAERD